MKLNKKGFTLVELLAVIVILAVVMLIGGTTVLPMMQKAQKSTLGTEGAGLKSGANTAYQSELMKGVSAQWKATESVCFSLKDLCYLGAFDKGCDSTKDGYTGSVLVTPGNPTTYNIWISNGTYVFGTNAADGGLTPETITDAEKATDGATASENCGGAGDKKTGVDFIVSSDGKISKKPAPAPAS